MGVDVGFSVWGSRTAQAMADTAALDLARYLDFADANGANQATAEGIINGILPLVRTDNGSDAGLTATVGKWTNGVWTVPASCAAPLTPPAPLGCNAIMVTATQKVPQIFFGGFNTLSARSAIAANTPEAGFSIGTFLANVDTQQSATLNAILGSVGSANLTLVGYQGVATSYVTLNQLISADSTVLSPTNILSYSMTPQGWSSVLETALGKQINGVNCNGANPPGACEAYNQVLDAGGQIAFSGTQQVKLCQLFWINPTTLPTGSMNSCSNTSVSSTGLNASLNVLQMLTTTAEVANGTNAIDLHSALNITGITSAETTLQVVQPPVVAYGVVGTKAYTAQIDASVNISALGLSLLGITLDGATGTATLSNINCSGNVMQQTSINASTTAASGSVTLAGVNIASIGVTGASLSTLTFAGSNVPPTPNTLANDYNPVQIGTTSPSLTYSGLSPLSLAAPLLNGTLDTVLPSVLSTLGVTLAGADVADLSADCDAVSIVK
jgi:uncharacterized membrane protein